MFLKIEIENKPGIFDAVGSSLKEDIKDLGIKGVDEVRFIQVYLLEGEIDEPEAKRIASELLVDPVIQMFTINDGVREKTEVNQRGTHTLVVAYNPGVMDPVEDSARKAILDLGIKGIKSVKTAKQYLLKGRISREQLATISDKLLVNKVIQHLVEDSKFWEAHEISYRFELRHVKILNMDSRQLLSLSKEGQLFLLNVSSYFSLTVSKFLGTVVSILFCL